ncbi:12-oxophytodienoate reductase 1 [Glycine soja]|uniref:12-oxophytodienoate reductase 1 n=1 Tax=Glycine soja TaxID=3848 RepID=A0A445GC50_GLYSO|nr:12-oxophytodienoate reductase 1 [Glycine soja]
MRSACTFLENPPLSVIRAAMDEDIKGAIVILDEAHNIEDIARDVGSVDIEEDVLDMSAAFVQDLTSWMEQKKNKLEKRDFQHYVAIKVATDSETDTANKCHVSDNFGRNGSHMLDYQLALQRCVRNDTDERFREERNRAFISKWLRRPLRVYENFDLSLEGLKSFFENAKEHYGINTVRATQSLGLNGDVVQNKDQNAWFTRKKKQKLNKSGNGDGRETSVIENNISFPTLTSPDLIESQPSAQKNSNTYNCKYLPQCSNQTEPRDTHGANGYLLDQFLKDKVNGRDDDAGIRLSPFADYNDCGDSDPQAYIGHSHSSHQLGRPSKTGLLLWLVARIGLRDRNEAISTGAAHLVAYGRLFLANNPDLPTRFHLDAHLNQPDVTTFYTHHPVLSSTQPQVMLL